MRRRRQGANPASAAARRIRVYRAIGGAGRAGELATPSDADAGGNSHLARSAGAGGTGRAREDDGRPRADGAGGGFTTGA